MDIASFLLGTCSTFILGIIAVSIYEYRERYVTIPRDEYEAIKREALRNVAKVRRLVEEERTAKPKLSE